MKSYLRWLILVAVLASCSPAFAQQVNVFLSITAPWRYTTNNLDGTNWMASSYDDSTWSGPSNALLYIETSALPAPKNTPLPEKPPSGPRTTYYFRTSFVVTNSAEVSQLVFSNLLDDGAVYYLNGNEIYRLRLPTGTIVYTNLAPTQPPGGDATAYEMFFLTGSSLTNLVTGTNTLAAEVHQFSPGSGDVVFGSAVAGLIEPVSVLTRGPYLQLSTPTSIVVRWRTDIAEAGQVAYGTNLATLNLTNIDSTPVAEHIVTLTNLQPDTKYFYSVGSANNTLAGPAADYFFLTHPPSGTPKPVRIWVIGDAGTADTNQVAVRDAFQNFNGTNTLHAWLQLGDNAYEDGLDGEYQNAMFNIYTNQLRNSVTWPTLGNHDTAQSTAFVDTYAYFNIFTLPTNGQAGGVASVTEHYYSFDLGMIHFICLDAMTANRATNAAMATWLRSDLALTTNRWLVAFWHHPPYTRGSHDSDSEGESVEMRENFLPILEAGGVDLVLCGHSHVYERSLLIDGHYGPSFSFTTNHVIQTGSGRETNGIGAYHKPDGLGESPIGNRGTVYVVAGNAGEIQGGSLNYPAMFWSVNEFGSLVLDFKDNRLDFIFLRQDGATNDSFTIIKDGAHPPVLTNMLATPEGGIQFTVVGRAFRTNTIETTTNLAPPIAWTPVSTNVPPDNTFNFTNPNPSADSMRFYRVKKP